MGRKNRNANDEFWESANANKMGYYSYYNRLVELALSIFEWKNLPKEIDPRYLELCLFSQGKVLFFKDEELNEYLTLKCTAQGKWDIYDRPTERMAIATNGYRRWLNDKNSVIIYNNYLRTSSIPDIDRFARRLWNIDRTIDVNINAQKTPILIKTDQSQLQTLKNAYMKYEGNEPVIFGSKAFDSDGISVLYTNAPYVADKLQIQRNQIWNEALTYLGVSNVNVIKKERLVTDEVSRNLGGVMVSRYSRLNMRKEACKQINEMFGLNIDCEYREDIKSVTENMSETETGGNADE